MKNLVFLEKKSLEHSKLLLFLSLIPFCITGFNGAGGLN